ncbi:Isochorismatase hydrolase [Dacryopinax primogenitus]|uniref:Isochorismatase hydrolase n=1 Tax=Dacryopinax primogenitus (strain DJM 731) TaxID=1858805 RepID=M5G9T4_DACPD|nr:Isochorismatase hydrolase [Dacryopinax primogenitus]EJU05055.1 Isochorismatase hydrolase [Dacryopinax primogenitus]
MATGSQTITVNPGDTALVLVGLQQGCRNFHQGAPMVPMHTQLAGSVAALLAAFRHYLGSCIVHVREDQSDPESFLHPGQPGHQFETWATPATGEVVIAKTTLDAFLVTDLQAVLELYRIRTVLLVGYTTERDVHATANSAQLRGYQVVVVPDATATWGEPEARVTALDAWQDGIRTLQGNGVTLKATNVVLAELGG